MRRAALTPVPAAFGVARVRRRLAPRISLTIPQLAAACLAVIAVSVAGVLYLEGGHRTRDRRAPVPLTPPAAATMAESQDAIRDVERLRQVLASRRDELDPATVAALEKSLRSIDDAIRQAQLALQADPKNPYLRDHLDDTMRRKVDLMRRATMLASAD